ncbi:Stk1 family PASTA domain-containing Ser/Thr kinase [Rubrobacter tropicus]|uniref:non-specific serine/threonine protein kinase n=1 Tax=Rubrobacter tropicus TaxID=2653851 RepID=A0A6G8Q439_9ACTN|nr:Stk1 family PASTA domain-containing Ser/Thr kinase [Rubrobacter tropicus]QIN81199.1 Stk1 family PASTA domain-containing Ser/Thr kinase [Rubrobacter tropicus]
MQQLVDNRYRLQQPLGSGGMAEVFLAHDDVLDRDVALKVMSVRYAGDEEFVERFKREAQSAAALSHPNIVSIFDRGEADDGTYYIAMEYLSGGTLKDRILKRGALPPRTAAAVALQIAEALKAAHERDVIHRDIKPHNILITGSGDVKVTDFGIARAASSSTMTRTGHILGTAHYISPEQAMGEPVGPASDLYSLGVVLYEMLTGEMPFDADTPLGIAMKHVNGHLVPPQILNEAVPDGINAVTVRLLAKDPADRYGSDAELIEDLERVVAGLDPAGATTEMMTAAMPAAATRVGPQQPPQSVRRKGKRRRRAMPLILALLALLILAPLAWAGYSLLGNQQEEAPPPAMISVPDLVNMDVDRAEDEFGDDFDIETTAEREDEQSVGTILSQDPESGGEAREGSTISVEVVGTQVADIPNVVGDDRNVAEEALRDAGFEVSTDEKESSFEDEDLVIGQEPGGGRTVERGSEVTITVGTGPDTVEVPDVTGNNLDQAQPILERAGLTLGEVVEDYSDTVPEGSIISQDPVDGESLEPGDEVDVTVSLGVQQVEVPAVYGATLSEAQALLENAGLFSSPVEVPGDEAAGTALETDPGVGALVDPGSTLTLYYSAGPPEPTVASPEPTTTEPDNQNRPGNSGNGNGGNGNGRPNGGSNVPPNVQENVNNNDNVPGGGQGNGNGRPNRGNRGGND